MGGLRSARTPVTVMILAAAIWGLLQLPVDVPDANSPEQGNHPGIVNGTNAVGQTLIASRDGLNRLEVTLAVANPVEGADVLLRVEEVPGKFVREVKRPLTALPHGNVGDFRPGTMMQRWYSFDFEPIPDSAGKRFYFVLEGKELQDSNSVGLLMFFHNAYPDGEAFINGNPAGAHVVFRAYSRGGLQDLIGVLAKNMVADRPGLLGNPLSLGALVCTYVVLSLGAVQMTRKMR